MLALSLVFAVFLWGGNNAGVKFIVGAWPPIWTGASRFLCAGLVLLLTIGAPSALRSSARNFRCSLQRMHGFGVRPAWYSRTNGSITSLRNSSRRLRT